MMLKVGIGDRRRVDGRAADALFEQLQKRCDEIRQHAVDIQSNFHRGHNLGKMVEGVNRMNSESEY